MFFAAIGDNTPHQVFDRDHRYIEHEVILRAIDIRVFKLK